MTTSASKPIIEEAEPEAVTDAMDWKASGLRCRQSPPHNPMRRRDNMPGITNAAGADVVEPNGLERVWDDAVRRADQTLTPAERKVQHNLLAQARTQW